MTSCLFMTSMYMQYNHRLFFPPFPPISMDLIISLGSIVLVF